MIALTPFIPLPFVDDMVKGWLARRMVQQLAEAHRLKIWDDEVNTLIADPPKNYIGGFIKKAILLPVRFVLRKIFMVLAGKHIVDLATETYHRAWLIDLTFARRWCAPHGPRSAAEVREGIDAVLKLTPVATSPITRALKLGLERSQPLLADVYDKLRARLGGHHGRMPGDDDVSRAVDDAEATGIGGVVEQLRRALFEVPSEHFVELERLLARELATHSELTKD
jgi:hypothetical protein